MNDFGKVSNQVHSRGHISPCSAELRKRCTIQTALCVLSLVWKAVGLSVIICERGEALYNDEKASQGVFLFIHRGNTDVHASPAQEHMNESARTLLLEKSARGRTGSNHGLEKHSSGIHGSH